jgi:hypothetical protein
MDSSRLETLIWENMEDLDDEDEINAVISKFWSFIRFSQKTIPKGHDYR